MEGDPVSKAFAGYLQALKLKDLRDRYTPRDDVDLSSVNSDDIALRNATAADAARLASLATVLVDLEEVRLLRTALANLSGLDTHYLDHKLARTELRLVTRKDGK